MMRFTVVWDREVEAAFVGVWIAGDAPTRHVLTSVANWIDSKLAADPHLLGGNDAESSTCRVEVPTNNPAARISVVFQVLADDRIVRVVRIMFSTE